jgi:Cu(I)/Ag(I) efflux system membrane fusion protein
MRTSITHGLLFVAISFLSVMCRQTETVHQDTVTTDTALMHHSKRWIHPQEKTVTPAISVHGSFEYDLTSLMKIAARTDGRIEKLYVRYAYQEIKKGDRLFDVYSPDIVAAQQELIALIQHPYTLNELKEAAPLIHEARKRLRNMGLTSDQVDKIERSTSPQRLVTIFSDVEGHVHGGSGDAGPSMSMQTQGMDASSIPLKEGSYVKKGDVLLELVYPHTLFAVCRLPVSDLKKISIGSDASISVDDFQDTLIASKVQQILPLIGQKKSLVSVRMRLNNFNHRLSAGQLFRAEIKGKEHRALWIPSASVMDLGKRKAVWKRDSVGGVVPVTVVTGIEHEGFAEIISGLDARDEIASDASFHSDSETIIRINGK